MSRNQYPLAQAVRIEVPGNAQIGIDGGNERLLAPPVGFQIHFSSVAFFCPYGVLPYFGVKIPLSALSEIRPVRLDERAEKRESGRNLTEEYLVGMKFETEFTGKKIPDFRNEGPEEIRIRVHQNEIIHVPAVIPDAEFFFDEFVERVEVEVREYLAREVSDGKPGAVGSEKQALRPGKPDPAMSVAFYDAVRGRIVAEHCTDKEPEGFSMFAPVFFGDDPLDHGEQDAPVDRHEKSGNVELEHVGFPGMRIRDGTGELLHSPDAEERALALATGIGIVDERPFENGFELVHDEMVYDPVAEVPRENLALHGMFDDEGDARADRIRPLPDIVRERKEAGLVIDLEPQGVQGFSLPAATVEVGLEKLMDEHGGK